MNRRETATRGNGVTIEASVGRRRIIEHHIFKRHAAGAIIDKFNTSLGDILNRPTGPVSVCSRISRHGETTRGIENVDTCEGIARRDALERQGIDIQTGIAIDGNGWHTRPAQRSGRVRDRERPADAVRANAAQMNPLVRAAGRRQRIQGHH